MFVFCANMADFGFHINGIFSVCLFPVMLFHIYCRLHISSVYLVVFSTPH